MKVKRQAHKKRKPDNDTVARGTAAVFTTAAVRLLLREYGWERAAAAEFGDRLMRAAVELATEFVRDTGSVVMTGAGEAADQSADPPGNSDPTAG
jgi:hypothetical protein